MFWFPVIINDRLSSEYVGFAFMDAVILLFFSCFEFSIEPKKENLKLTVISKCVCLNTLEMSII